jgi:hypothetical protein
VGTLIQLLGRQKGIAYQLLASQILEGILEAPARHTVSRNLFTRFSLISHAITLPCPFMRAASWTVLFPGAAQASSTCKGPLDFQLLSYTLLK